MSESRASRGTNNEDGHVSEMLHLLDARADGRLNERSRLGCSVIVSFGDLSVLNFTLRSWPNNSEGIVDWRLHAGEADQSPLRPVRVAHGGGRLPTGLCAYSGIAVFEHQASSAIVAASGNVAGRNVLTTGRAMELKSGDDLCMEVFDTSSAPITRHLDVVERLRSFWFGSPLVDRVVRVAGTTTRIGQLSVTPLFAETRGLVQRICVRLGGADGTPHFWQVRLDDGEIGWALTEVEYTVADIRFCHLLYVDTG